MVRRVANQNIQPMLPPQQVGGYQGYGAPSEQELLEAMAPKEGNFSPVQKVPDSYNPDALNRDRDLLYAMQGNALDSSPTSLAGGLSRLGQAWLARGADKRITQREDEMRAADETKAMQAQQKQSEMIAAMLGPDASPQDMAMAEMFPEQFVGGQIDMRVNAAKPQKTEGPKYFTDTVIEGGKPMRYEFQHGNPDYKRPLGEGQARSALVENKIGTDGSAPAWGSLPVGGYVGEGIMDLTNTAEWKAGKLPFKSGAEPGSIEWRSSSGSTAEADAAAAAAKREGRFADGQRAGATVLREVNRGIGMLDQIYGEKSADGTEADVKPGLGTMAGAAKRIAAAQIPGTAEYIFVKNIESALANVGLDRIQEMRDNSPTGGALGQVPIQQQARLEQTIGALNDLGLPRAYIEENLRYANNAYLDIIYGSPSERAGLVESGVISPEDNEWIDKQYDKLGWDDYGNSVFSGNNLQPVVGRTLADGSRVTEGDILATMEATGLSRLEVEAQLRERLK